MPLYREVCALAARGTDRTKGIGSWPRQGAVTVPGVVTGARAADAGRRPAAAFGDLPEPADRLTHRRMARPQAGKRGRSVINVNNSVAVQRY